MAWRSPRIPRPEHPRPQFLRGDWINLNGAWTFAPDAGRSGKARGLAAAGGFDRRIIVPFCPESRLSGVGHTDFLECLWYHRAIDIPAAWAGRRVLLHFGAVDFFSEVYVDGGLAGRHWGGSAGFTHDITALVQPGGRHDLVVHVRDDVRSGRQGRGKQCPDFASRGCLYTRTTGIWQTVWLEAVHPLGLRDGHVLPDLDGGRFVVLPQFRAQRAGARFRATLFEGRRAVAAVETAAANGAPAVLAPDTPKPWSPASPHLYGLRLEVLDRDGETLDAVDSYAGLRKVHVQDGHICLNNERLYLRLVLDQGFYPDGIWTAPSDAALRGDIELAMRAGFNGARLHQKVFEERFHYWADRMGYLTWGEYSDWGMAIFQNAGTAEAAAASAWNFHGEWADIVVRDRNHPSIIAWTPFNETGNSPDWPLHDRLQVEAYELTRSLDPTRPVNDSAGWSHARTDLWTIHDYEQDGSKLAAHVAAGPVEPVKPERGERVSAIADGQAYIVDEFGGIKWVPPVLRPHGGDSWGYGTAPRTLKEFYARLEAHVAALNQPHVAGFCYTQLTDVEQEQNGIYKYDRTPKFDVRKIAKIIRGEAAKG